MKIIRIFLFPFSILYGIITSIRNFLFDVGVLKSYSFNISIICVGNLNVGGTGKTPQIEYLIRLLSNKYEVATLSRGYKRKSKGFVLANENSNVEILGDEPFQFFEKFKNIQVAVDADRKNGIEKLLALTKKPTLILLDDAYQHRKIKAGFYIMLTSYNDLFCNDFMLPTGNLRESRNGAKRANMIIVTKCPKNLLEIAQQEIKVKINLQIPIFFSTIEYDTSIYSNNKKLELKEIDNTEKIVIAGIAKPKPFFDYLKNEKDVILTFPDHHHFTENDIQNIKNKAKNKLIITTEKDFVRLKNANIDNLFYLPIKSKILKDETLFNQTILNYVEQSTRN
jgi:tetraacyldisaccharide 4'-kinase